MNSKAEKEIMNFFLMNKLNSEPIAIDYEPDLLGFRPDFACTPCGINAKYTALEEKVPPI